MNASQLKPVAGVLADAPMIVAVVVTDHVQLQLLLPHAPRKFPARLAHPQRRAGEQSSQPGI